MLKWLSFIALVVVCGASVRPVQDEPLTFDWNGIEHHETREVQGDIVTLKNEEDGFTVTLDYERDVIMIKNVTSKVCFFASLESIPVPKDLKVPFMFQTVTDETTTTVTGRQDIDPIMFSVVGKIPANYIMITNDETVSEECVEGTSLWIERKASRKRFTWDWDTWTLRADTSFEQALKDYGGDALVVGAIFYGLSFLG